MTLETIIWLIPLPPLLAFLIILLFTYRNRALSHWVAITAAVLSWAGGLYLLWSALNIEDFAENPINISIPWLPTGADWLHVGVYFDTLTAVTLFFAIWTILAIFVYSVGYHNYGQPKGDHDRPGLPPEGATEMDAQGHSHRVMSIEPMYARFFALIGLFAFGMYVLIVSDNLLTLFVGWEIMGLCSYLLIGFWYGKPSARNAMIKAFMTTRVGDMFMLLGIAYLYSMTGSLSYVDTIYNPEVLERLANTDAVWGFLGLSAAGLIGMLLFFGTIGKSAQWPLHVWLPDAMEGPTPVSAMIHAATMVSAGIYLIIRIFPLLTAGGGHGHLTTTMIFISFIGTFTAIFAATIAVAQNDIKRVLAYSTISQLGYMVAAVGIGAYVAAAFHLVTHAFFKALLFLDSGSVIHGMEHGVYHTGEHIDAQDMFNMGGLRKKMPITFWTFVIGGLALSGFPIIVAGFWSKDEILSDAFANHHLAVFITLAVAAFLTAFYTGRQITLTFLGKSRSNASEHAHESKWVMTVPLMVLAFFTVTVGWTGIPSDFPILGGIVPNWFHKFVSASLVEEPEAIRFNFVPLLTSLVVSLGGLSLGYFIYRNVEAKEPDPLAKPLGFVYKVLQNKYYFDELYDYIFVRPSKWLAEQFSYYFIDRTLIDGALHALAAFVGIFGSFLRNRIDKPIVNGFGDFVGESTKKIGKESRLIQTGRVQQYMIMGLATLTAIAALLFYLFVGID
jgi:NADH-quinone oxidoreductase subunit L